MVEDPAIAREDPLNQRVFNAVADSFAQEAAQASPLPTNKPGY